MYFRHASNRMLEVIRSKINSVHMFICNHKCELLGGAAAAVGLFSAGPALFPSYSSASSAMANQFFHHKSTFSSDIKRWVVMVERKIVACVRDCSFASSCTLSHITNNLWQVCGTSILLSGAIFGGIIMYNTENHSLNAPLEEAHCSTRLETKKSVVGENSKMVNYLSNLLKDLRFLCALLDGESVSVLKKDTNTLLQTISGEHVSVSDLQQNSVTSLHSYRTNIVAKVERSLSEKRCKHSSSCFRVALFLVVLLSYRMKAVPKQYYWLVSIVYAKLHQLNVVPS
jgi:hypothetical protein